MLVSLLSWVASTFAGVAAAFGVISIGLGVAERVASGYGDEDLIDRPSRKYKSYDKTDEQIDYLCRVRREAKLRGEHIC